MVFECLLRRITLSIMKIFYDEEHVTATQVDNLDASTTALQVYAASAPSQVSHL